MSNIPPRFLRHFALYVNNTTYAGKIDEITPPVLEFEVEDYRSGGMDTSYPLEKGMKKLEMSFTIADYDFSLLNLFGFREGNTSLFSINGSMQRNSETPIPIIITARGFIKKLDKGTWKPNEKTTLKADIDLTYYKEEQGGVKLYEIDSLNLIRFIRGRDELAITRAILNF
jgi:P2 family phage contractile tail tube protein